MLAAAVPAQAATVVNCANTTGVCIAVDENVNVANGTNQTSVTGATQNTGVSVLFTSDGNRLDSANGAASVSATDGVLENLTFTLQSGATFRTAEFNLTPLSGNNPLEAAFVLFTFSDGTSSLQAVSGNGVNRFGVTAGSVGISSVQFVTQGIAGLGVTDLRQLRLGGVTTMNAVPEPGTWAMMLLGFGGMGVAMRRRRKTGGMLQIA